MHHSRFRWSCDPQLRLPPAQMCKGATSEEREQFRIPDNLEDFSYLSASGCSQIAGVDDAADFAHVKHSMEVVGITPESQVWAATIATLVPLRQGRGVHRRGASLPSAGQRACR